MLQNIKALYGDRLLAVDGDIGTIKDVYFDEKTWAIRYVVADTGSWLAGRLVLLAPHGLGTLDQPGRVLHLKLSKQQVADSPPIESHQVVSRQYEIDYYRYYGWPVYWNTGALLGYGGFPIVLPPSRAEMDAGTKALQHPERHLRSAKAIAGYEIHATDGPIGHLCSLLVEDQTWVIRNLVVETGHWYAGKEIAVSAVKVSRISYEDSRILLSLTQAEVEREAVVNFASVVAENSDAEVIRD
jgi:hypothetical protein